MKISKKLMSCVLALVLVVPFIALQPAEVKAANSNDVNSLINVSVNGATTNLGGSSGSINYVAKMEADDTIVLDLKFTNAQNNFNSLKGNVVFPEGYVDTVDAVVYGTGKNIDSTSNWQMNAKTIEVCSQTGYEKSEFIIATYNSSTTNSIAQSTAFAQIKLHLKKSIDQKATIRIKNVVYNGTSYDGEFPLEITNSMYGNRNVILSVPETQTYTVLNSDAGLPTVESDDGMVQIPITVDKNTGFSGIHLKVSYTTSYLTFEGLTRGSAALHAGSIFNTIPASAGQNYFWITMSGTENLTIENEVLCYLEFSTTNAVKDGTSAWVSVEVSSLDNDNTKVINTSETTITASVKSTNTNGIGQTTINFTNGPDMGDVNGDKSVDLIDATWALQYYNGSRVLSTVEKNRADMDKNGEVTLVDVLKIMETYNAQSQLAKTTK